MAKAPAIDEGVSVEQHEALKREYVDNHNAMCILVMRIEELARAGVLNKAEVILPPVQKWWEKALMEARSRDRAVRSASKHDAERAVALKKLTPREREIWGLPQQPPKTPAPSRMPKA